MGARATCAAAAFSLALSGDAAAVSDVRAWLGEPDLRAALVRLWRSAGWSVLQMESAAWVVERDGRPELVLWTGATGPHHATWKGPVPRGAVALVHTHPRGDDPRPSSRDVATAREIDLPVTVVTRFALWTASPAGSVAKDADASWTRELPSRSRP